MKSITFKCLAVSVLLAIGLVGWITLFGSEGWLAYRRLAQTEAVMRQRIDHLRDRNERLSRKIYRLKHDQDYLERIIRQQLEMGKHNELVFKFR